MEKPTLSSFLPFQLYASSHVVINFHGFEIFFGLLVILWDINKLISVYFQDVEDCYLLYLMLHHQVDLFFIVLFSTGRQKKKKKDLGMQDTRRSQ